MKQQKMEPKWDYTPLNARLILEILPQNTVNMDEVNEGMK